MWDPGTPSSKCRIKVVKTNFLQTLSLKLLLVKAISPSWRKGRYMSRSTCSPPEFSPTKERLSRMQEEDDIMELICDVVGTIASPHMRSSDLDIYDIIEVVPTNGNDEERAQTSHGGDNSSVHSNGSILLQSFPGAEEAPIQPLAPALEQKSGHINTVLCPHNARGDTLFSTKDVGSSSSRRSVTDSEVTLEDSKNLFNKYETQPVQILRQKIETIETIEMEKGRLRYRSVPLSLLLPPSSLFHLSRDVWWLFCSFLFRSTLLN